MKILVSRPDKIGDIVLALHAAKQLKLNLPDAEVWMHISEYTQDLVKNVRFIDGVALGSDIPKGYFDVVVDLMAKYQSARLFYEAGIKLRVGNSARAHSFLYNRKRYIRRSKALINEAEYNWSLLSLVSETLRYSNLTTRLNADDFKEITEYKEFENYHVLMPSITSSAIGWDLDNWLELAKLLAKQSDQHVIFLLGPAESSLEETIRLAVADLDQITTHSFDTFPEVLGFLKSAESYVGTSTGITHLADAVACKGVALYPENQSMHPRRWQPFNHNLNVLSLSQNPSPQDVVEVLKSKVVDERLDPLKRVPVSAFIVCCNEEKNIRRALESIKWCDEIVVVDSGSQDTTLDIVREYTDQIYHRDWTGNRDQKDYALGLCKHEWVLNIDADEEVSMELRGKLEKILANPRSAARGYDLSRLIHYLGRWWDKGGWYPEYRLRFFQKEYVTWGGKDPHEKAILKGRAKKLKSHIYHYTYRDIEHQVECLHKHASMMAKSLYRDGKKARIYNILLNPLFRFFKFYVLKFGFRQGWHGVLVGILESYYTYLKYLLLWDLHRKDKVKQ